MTQQKKRSQRWVDALERVVKYFRVFKTTARRRLFRLRFEHQPIEGRSGRATKPQTLINRDAVQLGREAGGPPKALEPAEDPQKNLLGQISRLGMTHETIGKSVHLAVKAIIKRSLGETVPMLAARQ